MGQMEVRSAMITPFPHTSNLSSQHLLSPERSELSLIIPFHFKGPCAPWASRDVTHPVCQLLSSCVPSAALSSWIDCSRTPQAEELVNNRNVFLGFGSCCVQRSGAGEGGARLSASFTLTGRLCLPGVCLCGFGPQGLVISLKSPPNVAPLWLGF